MVDYSYYNNSWNANIDSLNQYRSNNSNFNYVPSPMVAGQIPWVNSVWANYAPMSSYVSANNNDKSLNQASFETVDQYNERMKNEAIVRQKAIQDRIKNGAVDIVNGEIKVDDKTRKEMKKDALNNLEQSNKDSHSLGMSLLLGGTMVGATSSSIRNMHKVSENSKITELMNKTAYKALYEKAPITMIEAQKEMGYLHRQYLKQLHKYQKAGRNTASLTKAYDRIVQEMQGALTSGNADEVAKVTSKITQTGRGLKFWKSHLNIAKRFSAMKKVDVSKAAAIKGNSWLSNLGGKSGLKMGVTMGLASIALDSGRIYDAFEKDTGDGFVQLGQSTLKALVPATIYTASDCVAKKLVNKFLPKLSSNVARGAGTKLTNKLCSWFTKQAGKKIIGKVCCKIGSKLAGKAIGAAIGSCIPGLGTVVGFAIGCVADWAIQKWVMPHSDVTDKNNIAAISDEEHLKEAYIRAAQGEKINPKVERLLANNPELCQKFQQEIIQAQQQTQAA